MSSLNAAKLAGSVEPLRSRLRTHPMYAAVAKDIGGLRIFTEHHVFAVWDFMCLLKSLQQIVTCVSVPWLPQGDATLRRFINEIVLGEECDLVEGKVVSHFEMYLDAMREIGAHTKPAERFVSLLRNRHLLQVALSESEVPQGAQLFVLRTMDLVHRQRPHEIAAAFTVGREELIPTMFRALIAERPEAPSTLLSYLDRHVELDEGEHGPLAAKLLAALCGDDDQKWAEASQAAHSSLRARIELWDAIYNEAKR